MKATGREIIDVLERVVELEWFRYPRKNSDGFISYAPVVVWRFRFPDSDEANRIIHSLHTVLSGFIGRELWSLRLFGKNWVLQPRLVQELEDSGRFKTDGDLLNFIRTEAPELGQRAFEDLVVIADALAHQIQI